MNEKYSSADFTNRDLSSEPAEDFNNTTIKGSCFAQCWADDDIIPSEGGKSIFPADMTGVTFERCNLDNVYVPPGNFVVAADGVESTNKTIKMQNDLEDWVMEKKGGVWEPKSPLREKLFDAYGISKLPANIPAEKMNKSIVTTAMEA